MTTKTSTAPPPTKRTRVHTKTIDVSPEQIINFLNRMTTALEVSNSLAQSMPRMFSASDIQAQTAAGFVGSYPDAPVESLQQMINSLNDQAAILYESSSKIRSLITGPEPIGDEPCNSASFGPLKDRAVATRDLLYGVSRNLDAIALYVVAN